MSISAAIPTMFQANEVGIRRKEIHPSPLGVRRASRADAQPIAALCVQLGYPTSPEEVVRRLAKIEQDDDHALYVAELPGGGVIGWVHVYVSRLLVADPSAEIGGLVVDEAYRRRGVGRRLMEEAERWAGERGCAAINLRSNIIRKEAHAFYERIGYSNVKTQLKFHKPLR
jgi:GNAT superfamily N-acetyltransferase